MSKLIRESLKSQQHWICVEKGIDVQDYFLTSFIWKIFPKMPLYQGFSSEMMVFNIEGNYGTEYAVKSAN